MASDGARLIRPQMRQEQARPPMSDRGRPRRPSNVFDPSYEVDASGAPGGQHSTGATTPTGQASTIGNIQRNGCHCGRR